ncbi:MAG: 4'-phosphopantetheinyl transferase superfamily protein [Bacteroidales bacterium]|nr:4'-phosphopantetheinyl transferase superfamily protein [Bacteroidales bacterium]
MPVIFNKIVLDDIRVVIWKISETEDEIISLLPNYLKTEVLKFKHPERKKEFAASRLSVMEAGVNDEITCKKSGKPFTKSSFVGISHCDNYASAIVSKNNNVAIDIENFDERILRTAKRFLNQTEKEFCDNNIEKTTLIWSCKEVLFKLYGKGNVSFKDEINVKFVNENTLIGEIKNIQNINLERLYLSDNNNPVVIWCGRKPDNFME